MEFAGLDGLDEGDGLYAASSTQAVPCHALGGIHLDLAGVVEDLAQRLDLRDIPDQGTCGVCIHVIHLHGGSTACGYMRIWGEGGGRGWGRSIRPGLTTGGT